MANENTIESKVVAVFGNGQCKKCALPEHECKSQNLKKDGTVKVYGHSFEEVVEEVLEGEIEELWRFQRSVKGAMHWMAFGRLPAGWISSMRFESGDQIEKALKQVADQVNRLHDRLYAAERERDQMKNDIAAVRRVFNPPAQDEDEG